ncbi:helix-turn-helix domain-containing protein [Xenorhabdus bovienii]|uniref:Repressor of flagellae, MrxJ n=5 Tax=Xenorhabdus bovienii TaxID=40576 RepID=A0A0B6X3U6_XENBV|nr:helix-turn-helix transcriptional regulator [Xenorhabdus bovienii]CDG98070.1 Repressor of flagellae, MrxJ [Xenorhabdus bovienii str. puntauvense]CDH02293.1 Repressor of flagellae, MrxJ [Xenorhabdus bovienii str. feltiae Moldova]CDG87038.1 Repressor of flagellae, MrxJ [Xenorhabdus bovienii str. feltiae France]CDG92922.1 Repressor of flagellae, MrxJ [Xenorhabdus bovienii str. feltiae Florida]CDH25830.1 Repressor of flagellae, MrxJ [Xenorhabdus bovienii str. kraussei Becker Underwood]
MRVSMLVGKRIQMKRKEAGMTVAELADRISVSQQQLSRYERGTNKISLEHLVDVSIALKTPADWFLEDCFNKTQVHVKNQYAFVAETILDLY